MPHYLRYRFPGDVEPDEWPGPELRARSMAALFMLIPEHELTPGRLDSQAALLIDRGRLEYAIGQPMGEQLATWLWLVVAPGERRAWLDVDPDEMARVSTAAESARRSQPTTDGGATVANPQ